MGGSGGCQPQTPMNRSVILAVDGMSNLLIHIY